MITVVDPLFRFRAWVRECEHPEDVRGLGTCVRGTPGCLVSHPIGVPLPVIRHQGGTGQVRHTTSS